MMGAAMTGTAELNLSQPEARMLAQSTADVLRHYPSVKMPAQTIDWISLASALGMVYGPRLVAIRNNRRGKNAPQDLGSLNDIRAAAPPKQQTAQTAPKADAPIILHPAPPAPTAPPNGQVRVTDIPGLPGVTILRPVH
jgi:hypothetical protein